MKVITQYPVYHGDNVVTIDTLAEGYSGASGKFGSRKLAKRSLSGRSSAPAVMDSARTATMGRDSAKISNGVLQPTKGVTSIAVPKKKSASRPKPSSKKMVATRRPAPKRRTRPDYGNTLKVTATNMRVVRVGGSYRDKEDFGNLDGSSTSANIKDFQFWANSVKGANLSVDGKFGPLTSAAFSKYESEYTGKSAPVEKVITVEKKEPSKPSDKKPMSTEMKLGIGIGVLAVGVVLVRIVYKVIKKK